MAKVILICGKICCGKSTYAKNLRSQNNAVVLSVDEIMLALFGQYVGEKHDEYCENLQKYLFKKSLELIETGTNVILDWGFWQRDEREEAKSFFERRNINCELHYIDISDQAWAERVKKRNLTTEHGEPTDYYIDENLAKKFNSMFEPPSEEEFDKCIKG
ncbi:MAG TPA: ATP-binding protein [Ruminococcaceae bacterium]|nr:ATP-binding protein [Oscillospiraceae bacterium]